MSYRFLIAENEPKSLKLLYYVRFLPVMKLKKLLIWSFLTLVHKVLNLYDSEISVGDFYFWMLKTNPN